VATIFFAWTMHFLLAGSVIIDDSKTSGTIGVVVTFLSWFILIGSVVVLGAACGAVW
jgi:hypothetical protein